MIISIEEIIGLSILGLALIVIVATTLFGGEK